jgi:plastocyanin
MHNVVILSVALTVIVAACGGGGGNGGTPPPPPPVFTSLTVSASTLNMVDGDEEQLMATPRDQNGAAMSGLPAATFTLAAPSTAASVNMAGRVTALNPGTATVTASLTSSGVTKTATTNVNVTALPATAGVTASAAGTTFDPATVKIATGGQVTWSFPGQLHNVIWDGAVDPPGGDIGNHGNGDTEARSFPNAGSYPYHCSIHGASMNGTVTVRAP